MGTRKGTLTTTLSTSRAREPMARHMRPLLRPMLMWSHGMTPSTPIWSRRSTRISFGSHHETNHSLYSVATNVHNLFDPFATSSLSLEASCQYSQLEQTHLSDIKRSDRLRTNLILRYLAEKKKKKKKKKYSALIPA